LQTSDKHRQRVVSYPLQEIHGLAAQVVTQYLQKGSQHSMSLST
jgi:hypothetical protein